LICAAAVGITEDRAAPSIRPRRLAYKLWNYAGERASVVNSIITDARRAGRLYTAARRAIITANDRNAPLHAFISLLSI